MINLLLHFWRLVFMIHFVDALFKLLFPVLILILILLVFINIIHCLLCSLFFIGCRSFLQNDISSDGGTHWTNLSIEVGQTNIVIGLEYPKE